VGARLALAFFAFGLFSCTAPAPEANRAAPDAPAPQPAPPAAISDADLFGRWRIASLDGTAPSGRGTSAPWLAFGPGSYGGHSGCNGFGGMGVLQDGRFYAGGAMQTAIGCSALEAQERAIIGLVTASPAVSLAPEGRLTLSAAGRNIVLERDPAGPVAPARDEPPAILAGSAWTIGSIDGGWLADGVRRTLSFEAETWTLSGPCGTRSGGWRQEGDRIRPLGQVSATPSPCTAEAARLDAAAAAVMGSTARFATGPNGEILIGGGGHWIGGERPREALGDDAPLLAGSWRIERIGGAAPAGEPRIAFGPAGYGGTTGCNAFQGQYLAHRRRLFAGPALRTEQGCGELTAQEERIVALLAAAPGIARAAAGGLVLADGRGRLHLSRLSSSAPAVPQGRPWRGEPLTAELTWLDGAPLRTGSAEPALRLRLSAQRFDIEAGCGRLGGIWRRRGDALEFLTDAERRPEGACAGALSGRLSALMRLFNGPFRATVGANRELLIAGDEHWLAGYSDPPSRKPR
jgi:heat shock protein HslJ